VVCTRHIARTRTDLSGSRGDLHAGPAGRRTRRTRPVSEPRRLRLPQVQQRRFVRTGADL